MYFVKKQNLLYWKMWISIGLFGLTLFNGLVVKAAGIADALTTTATTAFGGGGIPLKEATPQSLIGRFLGIALSFLGIVFLILMIYGGFKWMLARGNSKGTDEAMELIRNAIIGLVIVLSAYAITVFIGGALTGT